MGLVSLPNSQQCLWHYHQTARAIQLRPIQSRHEANTLTKCLQLIIHFCQFVDAIYMSAMLLYQTDQETLC